MKTTTIHVASLLLLGMLSPLGRAQDRPKGEEKPKSEAQSTPAKALIVFAEYDGDKKVKSLPYTLYINAPDGPDLKPSSWARLRIGSRVPVYTGGTTGNMTYIDVGTNIDARAAHTGNNHFLLYLNLERSWVEGDVSVPVAKSDGSASETSAGHFREPIIRQFKTELDLKVREGQVVESTMATDPLTGRLLKIEVSVSVVK
jgi:hypothetical protein